MALVLLEGFDHEATGDYSQGGAGNQLFEKGWAVASEGPINYQPGRLPYSANSRAITVIQNNPLTKVLPTAHAQLIIGFAVKFLPLGGVGGVGEFLTLRPSGGSAACTLSHRDDWRLSIIDSTGSTVAIGPSQIYPGTWAYVELRLDVSGTVELHLNGLLGEIGSAPGDFGGVAVDTLAWVPSSLGSDLYLDDTYAVDPAVGSVNTGFLGDICVETLYPVSDGTYTGWTPDSGAAHYARVDEGQLDGDASYVATTTAGAKDSYGIGNPTLAATPVFGVQLNLGARKNDAGGRTIAPLIRQAGVDHLGPATALTGGWQFHSWLLDQDPAGADWLYTTVNTDEYGAELVS